MVLLEMGKYTWFLLHFHSGWMMGFYSCHKKLIKRLKTLIFGFGGRCLNIRDICIDFKPCLKVHNLVSVYPKSIKLRQMTHLNVILNAVVSVYRLVKLWNLPQFSPQFGNGLLLTVYCWPQCRLNFMQVFSSLFTVW